MLDKYDADWLMNEFADLRQRISDLEVKVTHIMSRSTQNVSRPFIEDQCHPE